jgi:hypothetical protein
LVNEGSFAVVNVCDDGKIADIDGHKDKSRRQKMGMDAAAMP